VNKAHVGWCSVLKTTIVSVASGIILLKPRQEYVPEFSHLSDFDFKYVGYMKFNAWGF
jgi:hypothetical protein